MVITVVHVTEVRDVLHLGARQGTAVSVDPRLERVMWDPIAIRRLGGRKPETA